MNIASIYARSSAYQPPVANPTGQQSRDLLGIQSALQMGDLSGAQKAIITFQQNIQTNLGKGIRTAQSEELLNPDSQTSKHFQLLQDSLQTGNLTRAQALFGAFKQDFQAVQPTGAVAEVQPQEAVGGVEEGPVADATMADIDSSVLPPRTFSEPLLNVLA